MTAGAVAESGLGSPERGDAALMTRTVQVLT